MQETSKQMVNHIRIMVEHAEGSAKESQVSNLIQYVHSYTHTVHTCALFMRAPCSYCTD